MNTKENDPDTLQIRDELDEQWTKRWRKATSKAIPQTKGVTIIVPPQEEIRYSSTQTKSET